MSQSKIILWLLAILFSSNLKAQTNNVFNFVMNSDSLYKNKKYSEAITIFEKGKKEQTSEFNFRMNDYYFIACCYAKIGNKNKAFSNLNKLVIKYEFSDTSIFRDKDLNNLKNDERWIEFRNATITNFKENERLRIKYSDLKNKLDSLYKIDQAEASYLNIENQNKYNQKGKDSINKFVYKSAQNRSKEVLELLKNVEWLDRSILGNDGFDMIFLSAQHSNDIKRMNHLLKLYKRNRRTPVEFAHYAMLYDKIQLLKNKKQRYATQIIINLTTGEKYYHELDDFNKVNEFRKYCYFDTIQDDMKWHHMTKFQESTQVKQQKIK